MREEILALIRELATMLEPGATAVWGIVLRQQIVMGTACAVFGGLLTLVGLLAALWARRDAAGHGEPVWSIVIGVTGLLIGPPFLAPGLMRLANPAYYAVCALLEMAK